MKNNCSTVATKTLRLVLASLLLSILLVIYLINSKEAPPRNNEVETPQREDIKPQVNSLPAISNDEQLPLAENKPDPNARPTRVGQKVNGYVMLCDGTMHKIKGDTVTLISTKDPSAIFKFPAENAIAGILTLKPGESLVGTPNYDGRFTKNFLKSLNEPINILADDTEETKELKRAVQQAKKELKAAYDRGEDIEEIMLKARSELQDLARYKQQLRREVLNYANREATSESDIDDFVQAANIMLENKGIGPIDEVPFARIKLKMKGRWEGEE